MFLNICDKCRHKSRPYMHIYYGRVTLCLARQGFISPAPITHSDIEDVIMNGECEYYRPLCDAEIEAILMDYGISKVE